MIQQVNDFLKTSNFSVVNICNENDRFYHFKVTSRDFNVSGYGSCETSEGAQTKALFEMIERFVFQKYSYNSDITSSGWAAHSSVDLSRLNAKNELIERDVLMCSWLLRRAPLEVLTEGFDILNSKAVHVFSKEPNLSIVGSFINLGEKKIYISCCTESIEMSFKKLQRDSERAIKILEKENVFNGNSDLSKHYRAGLESSSKDVLWLSQSSDGIKIVDFGYEYTDFQVNLWDGSVVWVSKVVNRNLQKLFWGTKFFTHLNRRRLRSIGKYTKINRLLHPFL